MPRRCWAQGLGPCEGKITKEHIISCSQLPETVSVKGFQWCKEEYKTIGRSSAVANILCKGHNNALSDADEEAMRFKHFLPHFFQACSPGKKIVVSDRFHTMKGTLFARWLCKTYCNIIMATGNRTPSADFARYAFALRPVRRMHFYIVAAIGKPLQADNEDFQFIDFFSPEGIVLACFSFWGFRWFAANAVVDESATDLLRYAGVSIPASQLLDRPESIVHPTKRRIAPRVLGKLRIEWEDK